MNLTTLTDKSITRKYFDSTPEVLLGKPQHFAGVIVAQFKFQRDTQIVSDPDRKRWQGFPNNQRIRPNFEARAIGDFQTAACHRVRSEADSRLGSSSS